MVYQIRKIFKTAGVLVPKLPFHLGSFVDPNDVVQEIIKEIDCWCDKTPYEKIIIVGYSAGGLVARKVYVVACGEPPNAPFELTIKQKQPSAWMGKVDRLILLAGMNRGWQISYHMNMWRAISWQIGVILLRFIAITIRREPLILSIRRGAPFITQLRIQWIKMREKAQENAQRGAHEGGDALTIQLLGSIDDFVAPADNVDLVSGGDFVYLDVPHSSHITITQMDDSSAGHERTRVFRRALTQSADDLMAGSILPQDDPRQSPDYKKSDVVFVVHGIRDEGYWTQKIARKVILLSRSPNSAKDFAAETASYGYFPMLPFLFSWKRREKVEWLMDQYAEMVARYPRARFHYVGHSNGTYCLAKALELYSSCRFERVVFAGSVLRRSFNWSRFLASAQIVSILNYVATADWVVAGFPKIFEHTRVLNRDLGGAGHDGFADWKKLANFCEVRFIRGSHDAAIREANWDAIAEYIYSGSPPPTMAPVATDRQNFWVRLIGAFPPIAWLAALTLAVSIGIVIGYVTYIVARLALSSVSAGLPESFLSHFSDLDNLSVAALTLAVVSGVVGVWRGLMSL